MRSRESGAGQSVFVVALEGRQNVEGYLPGWVVDPVGSRSPQDVRRHMRFRDSRCGDD